LRSSYRRKTQRQTFSKAPEGVSTANQVRSRFGLRARIEKADSAKMAKLIKLVGMLLQTKAYLVWKKTFQ
jgi:hypothetical protein